MLKLRKAEDRFSISYGWADRSYTFAYKEYDDPEHDGYRSLKAINDDIIDPSSGYEMHPHENTEIISYIVDGNLKHRDSLGTEEIVPTGGFQYLRSGKGAEHEELNASDSEKLRFFQICIEPKEKDLKPKYESVYISEEDKLNTFKLIASEDKPNSIHIYQDADVYISALEASKTLDFEFKPGRHGWLKVAKGKISVSGIEMKNGDGLYIDDEKSISIKGIDEKSEFLLFDLS